MRNFVRTLKWQLKGLKRSIFGGIDTWADITALSIVTFLVILANIAASWLITLIISWLAGALFHIEFSNTIKALIFVLLVIYSPVKVTLER